MKKKKGFTLTEVLVAVAIMGMITLIAIPLIRIIKDNNQQKEYESYAASLESAAKIYISSKEEDLLKNKESGCIIITYKTLKKQDLIKDITIQNTTCETTDTYVKIVKKDGNISYATSLVCKEKTNEEEYIEIIRLPKEAILNNNECIVE